MSDAQSPADRIRHAYARWHETRGESAQIFIDLIADDFEMRSVLDPPDLHPLAETRKGIDRARDYFSTLTDQMEMIEFPTEQVVADGDTVVWIGSCRWRDRASGREAATPKVDIWHFRNGKAVSLMEMFDTMAFARLTGLT